MKKSILLLFAIVLWVFSPNCYAKKPKKKKGSKKIEVQMPCQDRALDDENYYTALGISSPSPNYNFAARDARMQAQMQLADKLPSSVQLVQSDSTSIYKSEFSHHLNEVEVVCQKITFDEGGNYVVYVAVRMPRK